MGSIRFSVIIPTLNEAAHIGDTIGEIRRCRPDVEIIVSDGGSGDATAKIAAQHGALVVSSSKGRGTQFNAGARKATGEVFVFLNADSRLPDDAFGLLESFFCRSSVRIGTFLMRYDRRHWAFRFYAWFTRFDSVLTRFGDSGIVLRRSFFDDIGGFPDWPLFEDVEILQKARKVARIYTFPDYITTSARMFLKNGVFRQQLRASWFMIRYFAGASPERLYRRYYR